MGLGIRSGPAGNAKVALSLQLGSERSKLDGFFRQGEFALLGSRDNSSSLLPCWSALHLVVLAVATQACMNNTAFYVDCSCILFVMSMHAQLHAQHITW